MAKIEFGLIIPNGVRSAAERASYLQTMDHDLEQAAGHFGSLWMADHLQFGDGDVLEGWTGVTYFAARHPSFRCGHTVLCQSFRNPALLAKMGATLQFLSGGRFILGIGAGWHEEEYRAYGYEYPGPGARVQETEEAVQVLKALWHDQPATLQGKYFQIHEAYCQPPPDPVPPIMIGGRQPRMLRLIARLGDWWDVSGFGVGYEIYKQAAADMDKACAEVGRDPATLRRTFSAPVACAPTAEAAQAMAADRIRPGAGIIGTPEQIIAQIQAFHALGVDHFQFSALRTPEHASLDLLIREVIPAVNT